MRPYANAVFIVGNLGKPAKKMFTQGGKPYCFFSVAVSRDWRPGQKGPSPTDWVSCVSFSPKVVDNLTDDRVKGRTIMVSGTLQSYTRQNQQSDTKYTTMQVMAKYVHIVPPLDDNIPPEVESHPEDAPHGPEEDDEVPF